MNTTKRNMELMVYKLRESLGQDDFLRCDVTGANWTSAKHDNFVLDCLTLRRLANKHHRLAEMECNGDGVVRGVHYYNGTIDDYARRIYGHGVKPAYSNSVEMTVFDIESEKVALKIEAICKRIGLRVEFQGDPRGYTCKFYYGDRFLDIQQ